MTRQRSLSAYNAHTENAYQAVTNFCLSDLTTYRAGPTSLQYSLHQANNADWQYLKHIIQNTVIKNKIHIACYLKYVFFQNICCIFSFCIIIQINHKAEYVMHRVKNSIFIGVKFLAVPVVVKWRAVVINWTWSELAYWQVNCLMTIIPTIDQHCSTAGRRRYVYELWLLLILWRWCLVMLGVWACLGGLMGLWALAD